MEAIRARLLKETRQSSVRADEPMNLHTSFKTGGPADIFIDAGIDDLPVILSILRENKIDVAVFGNGSNVLVGDKGIRGAVVSLGNNAKGISIEGDEVTANAGELLSSVSKECARNALTGLEFAAGIPGSLGGGTFMNAGAYDGELSGVITEVTGVAKNGNNTMSFKNPECKFDYRTSIFQSEDIIITSVKMKLGFGNKTDIYTKIDDFTARRKEKQPLEYPSAGSTFKRPEGFFAGKLIEDAGLKGFCLGGAAVSEKHAGFIINKGDATSKDILELTDVVKKKVYKTAGVKLDLEVRLVGEF